LAVIEAIDDGNDVTSWKYIVHLPLALVIPSKIHYTLKVQHNSVHDVHVH
jgi:hypothetical protein